MSKNLITNESVIWDLDGKTLGIQGVFGAVEENKIAETQAYAQSSKLGKWFVLTEGFSKIVCAFGPGGVIAEPPSDFLESARRWYEQETNSPVT